MGQQLTIRYDDRLAREIEELARREGISRNQAVVRLLRKGAEIDEPAVVVGELLGGLRRGTRWEENFESVEGLAWIDPGER